ncbi:MAG: hypothetical protein V5A55_07595 [Halovenus sp.]
MTRRTRQGYGVLVTGIAVLGLLLVIHGAVVPGGADGEEGAVVAGEEPLLIQPVGNGSLLWPFTSKSESIDARTLAVNIIVHGKHERVEERFRGETAVDWEDQPFEDGDPDETDVVPEDVRDIIWRDAHGSDRYTYVEPPGGEGEWLPESYQLYEGAYLSERNHIRAYESPDPAEEWVAMQAHGEYFDYFRLKHTVTSTNDAQRYVESEFLADESVVVSQEFFDNADDAGSNGWVTIIEFFAAISAVGALGLLSTVRNRVRRRGKRLLDPVDLYRVREALLATTVVGLYVGVRVAGVALERQMGAVNPQLFAGLLYPVLAVGLPLAVHVVARPLELDDAFLVTAGALGAAVLIDFALIGVVDIPRAIILHRVLLALALGLIGAAGALYARDGVRVNELLVYGVSGWVVGLLVTLLDLL